MWVNKEWFDRIRRSAYGQSFGSHDANGWLGGVQAGCNYQVGGWVFGIQGDYDWTNASGSNANALFPGLTDSSKSSRSRPSPAASAMPGIASWATSRAVAPGSEITTPSSATPVVVHLGDRKRDSQWLDGWHRR